MDELLETKWNEYMGTLMTRRDGRSKNDILYDVRRMSFSPKAVTRLLDPIDVMRASYWDRMRAGWMSDFLLAAAYLKQDYYVDEVKDKYEDVNGFYKYIPYLTWDFMKYIKRVYNKCGKSNMRFVDVGGGIGDKALIAKVLMKFRYATSLEYNVDTHKIAKDAIGTGYGISVKRGDALKFNFGETSRPIFAYMYCPISHKDTLIQLYDRVAGTMPEGSVMYDIAQNCGYGDTFVEWANEIAGDELDMSPRMRIGKRWHEHVALGKIGGKPVLHILDDKREV